MNERDDLADLRAWRDEFARSHGYNLSAMVESLRSLDRDAGDRVILGVPRNTATVPAATPIRPASANSETGSANASIS